MEADEILCAVAERLRREPCLDLGVGDYEDRMNDRSRAYLHEEVAGLCAFDSFMIGKYTVAWRERFVVTRGNYRIADELGYLGSTALPVLLVSANAFDLLFAGRILRTSSLFETIAWWLEVLRLAFGAELPASMTKFKSMLAEQRDHAQEAAAETEQDTEPDEGGAAGPRRNRNRRAPGPSDLSSDEAAAAAPISDAVQRLITISEELKHKATRIDLSEVCRVAVDGAKIVRLGVLEKERCLAMPASGAVSF
jgi:hypothetical protein